MIKFAHPEYLYFLLIVPLLLIVTIINTLRKKKVLHTLIHTPLQDIVFGNKSFYKENIKNALILLAITLVILGFANPQLGTRVEEVKQVGIDVVICLDVSNSMMAEDLKPNRLELAKREIGDMMKRLQGDRIGLIVFAGDAYVQFPLTSDYSAANLFLNAVDVNSVPRPGTAVASAISMAVKSFDKNFKTQKVVVVITDGEDHEGNISEALTEAKDNNVVVYAIGMGSPQGAPIPVKDERGNNTGFRQDQDGQTVLTKLDEKTLMQIAGSANGKYYLSTPAGKELEAILKDLSSIEKSEYGTKRITDFEDKFYYFLIPALLLLLVEFFITDKRSEGFNAFLKKAGLRN
ncbi:MAG: VWA domain-containing protein [Ignavibacteriales bacterium]|nr:VWA domain-containing protein [Ignavibacteriales bacterium]